MARGGSAISWLLIAALLLVAVPACAQDEDGEGYGDDYDEGYGGDYGDHGMGGGMDGPGSPGRIPGVLDLDDLTFHKVADGTRPVFVEFYSADGDVGKKFEDLAQQLGSHHDLLLARVDGDEESELAKKYASNGLPALVFFGKGSGDPEVYDGPTEVEDMVDFLTGHVGHVGQLPSLAPFVERFLEPANAETRASIVQQVEAAVAEMTAMEAGYGKWYVKIMNNMIKKGDEYIPVEFSRLLRIVYDQADSLKEDKLAEFRIRLSVLKAFDPKLKEIEAAKKEQAKGMEDSEVDIDEHEEL